MNVNILKIICLISLLTLTQPYFSKYHRKCHLWKLQNHVNHFPIQRVPLYTSEYNHRQFTKTTQNIIYQNISFIYDEFVDAGGSGEVFRVEEQHSGKIRILKRFFKENQLEFQQQNFIMKQMQYEIKWHNQDNNPNKSTIASYPSKQSSVLRSLQIQNDQQYAVLFYKICKQIDKAHKKGIIHNDIKMGNILINSIGEGLRTIQVELIDWNLASFYTQGFETVDKKGTNCYYSPEALIRTNYITPAIDIWSLAVVYFTFITNKKPFSVNCKDDNFQAVLSLVSSNRFLEVYQKFNKASSSQIPMIEKIKKDMSLYEGISIRDRIPEQYEKLFDNQMIDLFEKMLQVDPEYRLTISQVLNHPYFERVKRLPRMYEEKKKKKQKQKEKEKQERQKPANNLVQPQVPSQFKLQQSQSL